MKKLFSLLFVCALTAVLINGCGTKKEDSSKAAIEKSKTLATTEEQGKYLEDQANAFYKSKDYQDAINIAQHILKKIDKESKNAKKLLEKSTKELKAQAEKTAKEVSNKLKNIGK